jgi:hypothetical protein
MAPLLCFAWLGQTILSDATLGLALLSSDFQYNRQSPENKWA